MNRTIKTIVLISIILLATGCSKKPRYTPVNETNLPVLYPKNYFGWGVSAGGLYEQYERFWGEEFEKPGIYIDPKISFYFSVNEWSGYNLLPVNWSFLLTGRQFSDSLRLVLNKIHLGVNTGITGFYYSGRSGFNVPAQTSLIGKYLFTNSLFATGRLGYTVPSLKEILENYISSSMSVGGQITEKASWQFEYTNNKFNIGENRVANIRAIDIYDGDDFNYLNLNLRGYLFKKHIFGYELELGYRNYDLGKNSYFKYGLNYWYSI